MDPIRIAVIGIGNIGALHLTNIEKLRLKLRLTAVCDIIPEKAQAAAARYGCAAYTDAEMLLKDGVCDAVIIATPHYFHTTIGIAALDSGHHVLVEKPISVHKADAERLIAAYEHTRARGGAGLRGDVQPAHRPSLPQGPPAGATRGIGSVVAR